MIILNADDYGLSSDVSDGIRRLAEHDRVSATSAIVTDERWGRDGPALRDLRGAIAVGLHVNLTLGTPCHQEARAQAFPALGTLVRRSLLRQLDVEALSREIACQIRYFRDATGFLPDHIDGHQHVHALPLVRTALIRAIHRFDWNAPPLIRVPAPQRNLANYKSRIIAMLAHGFRGEMERGGLPTNVTFGGISSFATTGDLKGEFEGAFETYRGCHLVMCHPGLGDHPPVPGDSIHARRIVEQHLFESWHDLPARIWHLKHRQANGAIDWASVI